MEYFSPEYLWLFVGFCCVGQHSLLLLVIDNLPSRKCRYISVPSGVMISMRVKTWIYKRHVFSFHSVGVSKIIESIHFMSDLSFVRRKWRCWIDCTCKLFFYVLKLCTRFLSQTLLKYVVFMLGNWWMSSHVPEFNW